MKADDRIAIDNKAVTKMNKRTFIGHLAKENNISLNEATWAYNIVINGIVNVVKTGTKLSLMGFGVFYLQDHKGHPIQFKEGDEQAGRNTHVEKYKVFKFSASNVLNGAIRAFSKECEEVTE